MTERNQPIEPEGGEVGLREICLILEVRTEIVTEWVAEGIVRPTEPGAGEWRFNAEELERARRARRLQQDFQLNTASLPLVLDLLGEVERLRRRLRVLEERFIE